MMLYDVLKASKGLYVDDEYAMLWGKQLGGWTVTTLTGTLPLTFRSNGTALINYRIYGTAEGAGVQTENLLEILITSGTVNNVTFTVDKNAGIITAKSSGATSAITTISWQKQFPAGTYIFSAQLNGANNTYRMDVSTQDWTFVCINYTGENTFTLSEETTLRFRAVIFSDYIADNVVFKPMVRLSDTTSEFIPYGYKLPMLVKQRTKNLVDLSSVTDSTSNGVTYTVDSINGTITANRIATSTSNSALTFSMTLPVGTYVFSCGDNSQRDVTYDSYLRIPGTTIARDNPDDPPGSEFTLADETTFTTYIRIQASYDAQNLVFRPMIRKDDTTPDFEPYYNIKQADIYIGDTKLATEDYVDYESGKIVRNGTPQDPPLPFPELETFEGTNTLDSTETLGEVTIKGMIKEAEQ
ncbi:MAG: hypothetical protein K6F27_00235 [Ruminococcus sp.]|nr:hypothetical protein [Ruminococcus sp.]